MKKVVLALGILCTLFVAFLVLDFLYPLDFDKLYRANSKVIINKNNQILRMSLSKDGFWRFYAKQSEIPLLLKKSVLLFEDKHFYNHFGINFFSIFRAYLHNLSSKNTIGASTIDMQVARMMQRKKRNYKNKLIEMFNALQLNWHFSKDEILLFYLNLAPYGGNIEGIKAASYFYFNKKPNELTISQIALLTSIPKNPNINRVDKQKNLKQKRKKILSLMYKNKIISKSQSLRANIEPIIRKRYDAPFLAPHFTNFALKNDISKVNIDLNIQKFLEKALKKATNASKHLDAKNAAALLIDNEKMSIIAYVGSENFNDNLGQNDGVLAIRSPGSTLKPFIYAKALDSGLITPKQELFDVPLHVGFYEPENFSKSFLGSVRADEALQYSLNIPAVWLNINLKQNSLYEMLKFANIHSLKHQKSYYGDAIALGGFGISLLDLTHLYTAFANDGMLLPLHVNKNEKAKKLFSKQSAYLVSEILANGIRPTLSAFWESTQDVPKIGYKTGTSADFKDLYTIGFSKKYTLGVWMGNFDGSKTKNLTGISTSSKVVFETFRFLNDISALSWLKFPKGISKMLTCNDGVKYEKCKNENYDFVINGVAKSRSCEFLRAEVLAYLINSKKIKNIKDLHKDPCYYKFKEHKPMFVSPYDKAEIFLSNKSKIMLKCYSFNENQKIFYKIDDNELILSNSGDEIFVNLSKGLHKISCIDSSSKIRTNIVNIKDSL